MPDPEFTLAPDTNNWMQDFAWDPLKDEIFMTQNIRTSNGRETIRINRLGPADDQGVRHFISAMTLTDAGHGDVLGLQRKGNALLLWISWSHYSGGTRKTDLVRFQWKAGTYNWSTRPPAFKIMPKFGIMQNVQAKLDPTGTYLLYRISGNGRDRYERRKVTEVESGVNHTYGKAGSFPLPKARATAMGWKIDGPCRAAQPSVIGVDSVPLDPSDRSPVADQLAGELLRRALRQELSCLDLLHHEGRFGFLIPSATGRRTETRGRSWSSSAKPLASTPKTPEARSQSLKQLPSGARRHQERGGDRDRADDNHDQRRDGDVQAGSHVLFSPATTGLSSIGPQAWRSALRRIGSAVPAVVSPVSAVVSPVSPVVPPVISPI